MSSFVRFDFPRVLLWVVAVIAPGGFLLLPYLAVQTIRERKARKDEVVGCVEEAPSSVVGHSSAQG